MFSDFLYDAESRRLHWRFITNYGCRLPDFLQAISYKIIEFPHLPMLAE